MKGLNERKNIGGNSIKSKVTDAGVENDGFVQANRSKWKEDVFIEDEDLPQLQNWFVSFNQYEE